MKILLCATLMMVLSLPASALAQAEAQPGASAPSSQPTSPLVQVHDLSDQPAQVRIWTRPALKGPLFKARRNFLSSLVSTGRASALR